MTALAILFEHQRWSWPSAPGWGAIAYNALGVFAFALVLWLMLARDLPPIASTLSVMFIAVLGVFGGALWLGGTLRWQDLAAVALVVLVVLVVLVGLVILVVLAIATELWPPRSATVREIRPEGG